MFEDAFESFNSTNKIYPKNIIIYRDGVGEGQKKTLFETEFKQIRAAMDSKCKDSKCVFVMVNKMVKTKFV